jgi:hypothetical protein
MRMPILLALAGTLAACGPEFELQSEIRRVRVLAIKAEPAELALSPDGASAPAPVQFTTLAVSPGERPVSVDLALCRSADAYGGSVKCPGEDGAPLPGGSLSLEDPNVQAVLASLAGEATGGGPVDPEDPALRAVLERGLPLFVGYLAQDGGEAPENQERGVRQLTLRLTDTPNQNPRLTDLLRDDAPLAGPLPLDTEVVLRPVLADGSLERYETDEGPRTEQVFYSWFATGEGEVKQLRSLEPVDGKPGDPTITYLTPTTPGTVTFHVVARDGRGGVDWLSRTVAVGP